MHDSPHQTPSDVIRIDLPDAAATEAFGARLGACLRAGDVVALTGDLGAGKTTLARAAIRAALDDPDLAVPSPTFTLVQTYDGETCPIWHVDLYRLDSPEDALELGLEDAFAEAAILIEWPDRLGPYLPQDRLELVLQEAGNGRRVAMRAGASWRDRLKEWAR